MSDQLSLKSAEVKKLVNGKLLELRKRLLDSTRRNPLINVPFRPNSSTLIRIVDELPDIIRYNLTNGKSMRLVSLPAIDEKLPDEQTDEFLDAFFIKKTTDEDYLSQIEELNPSADDYETNILKAERFLKDKIRANLNLPKRQTSESPDLSQHARNFNINPSYKLPFATDEHSDGRHNDLDLQTLLLPDKLNRVAKSVLEKGRSFQRETGVNVLHAVFGLLEWKDINEKKNFVSPLILLEIQLEKKSFARGPEFKILGVDSIQINTTLNQKFLTEHNIELPQLTGQSIEEYLQEVADKAPKGWHWNVRREVALGIFPSSKIAMYNDLDPSKRNISASKIVAKLLATSGTGDGSYAEVYETDDPDVARKVPYLVLDADASQYSSLVDASNGEDISIEGPPGSGKSQTIVNLIAAALAEEKKVLFVAEKLTALDVVKNRLDAVELGEFILPLQANKGSREKVYESLNDRLSLRKSSTEYLKLHELKQGDLHRRRSVLQGYLDTLGTDFGKTGYTVFQIIGHAIATDSIRKNLPREIKRISLEDSENTTLQEIENIYEDAKIYADRLKALSHMPKLWMASNAPILSINDAEDLGDSAIFLNEKLPLFKENINNSPLIKFIVDDPFNEDYSSILQEFSELAEISSGINSEVFGVLIDQKIRKRIEDVCKDIQQLELVKTELNSEFEDADIEKNIDLIQQAMTFAENNGNVISSKKHNKKIEQIQDRLLETEDLVFETSKLPKMWTERSGVTISGLKDDSKSLASYPDYIRELRVFDENLEAYSLGQEIKQTKKKIIEELDRIKLTLSLANDHKVTDLNNIANELKNAGPLKFISKSYKYAKNLYIQKLGGRSDVSPVQMVANIENYISWLNRKATFENDDRFTNLFKDIFCGINTEDKKLSLAVQFYEMCQSIASGDKKLQKSLEESTTINKVVKFSQLENAPNYTLRKLRTIIEEKDEILKNEKLNLKQAKTFLKYFNNVDKIKLDELIDENNLISSAQKIISKISSSGMDELIGDRFKGTKTDYKSLLKECELAKNISNKRNSEYIFDLIINPKEENNLSLLLPLINEFKLQLDEIKSSIFELCDKLKLSDEWNSPAFLLENLDVLSEAGKDPNSLLERAQLRRSEEQLRSQGFNDLVDWVLKQDDDFDIDLLPDITKAIIFKSMADTCFANFSNTLSGYDGQDFSRIRSEIKEKDKELIKSSRQAARDIIVNSANPPRGNSVGLKSSYTDMSLIYNEISKKSNRKGVRELTRRAGAALIELKPCWMMSPLAVAQYLHENVEFDLVVIDEASQMTPENAIGALSRAKQAIIVGDTKQLPPTTFFQKILDESDTDEDLREDSESILDLANIAFMPVRQLRWHYRSRHSALIEFSNQMMYKGELTIFPNAFETHPDLGVKLVEVDGFYNARRNEIEAREVVKAAVHHMENNAKYSLGICTMNTDQKDLILEEFEREHDRNPKVRAYINKWEQENDSLECFFIKNIETIQGDERDYIFISTLYGPEPNSKKVLQRFTSVNTAQGHRRLNVLLSRAKRKMVTFTSMVPSDIIVEGAKNFGVRMFRDWLEYSKTGKVSKFQKTDGVTESPFEDFVAKQIELLGCEVVPQVGVAGFRIDLGVKHPNWPYGFLLAVECDGATYHSSKSSRDRDRLRQEVLEGLGWTFHRIWSTDWFKNPQAEIRLLKQAIDNALKEAQASNVFDNLNSNNLKSNLTDILPNNEVTFEQDEHEIQITDEVTDNAKSYFEDTFDLSNDMKSISIGSFVKIEKRSDGSRMAFTISKNENDPDNNIISSSSPLGEALIDAQEGDDIEYIVGSYVQEVKVIEIS